MKRPFLLLIIFVFLFFPCLKAEEIPLALDEAVAIGLRDNRDMLLKAEEVKKAKEKIAEAEGAFFPTLDFLGGWTGTRGLSEKPLEIATTQTTVKQTLFAGGRIINTLRYNKAGFEAAEAVLDKARLEIILSINKAYHTLSLAKELSAINKAILDNTRSHLEYLRARFQSGEASDAEILKIEESLSSVEKAYEAALNQVESAQILLRGLLFLDEKISVRPKTQLDYRMQEIVYDEAFLKAMKTRPEIRQLDAQIEQSRKAIEIAKAGNRPTIYASWEYFSRSQSGVISTAGTITGSTGGSAKNWNDYSTLGFTFSWPVFNGWVTKAKVEQAIIDLKETQLLKGKTIKDIAAELKNAYLTLNNSIAALKSAEADLAVYKNELETVREKKQAGIASFLDLDDASLRYAISEFNKKQVVYDYIIAKAGFEKATGGF